MLSLLPPSLVGGFQPSWNIFVKLDHFPKFRGEKKNWNHHLVQYLKKHLLLPQICFPNDRWSSNFFFDVSAQEQWRFWWWRPLLAILETNRWISRDSQGKELPALKLPAKAPENGWLEYDCFLLGPGLCSGGELLVSGSVEEFPVLVNISNFWAFCIVLQKVYIELYTSTYIMRIVYLWTYVLTPNPFTSLWKQRQRTKHRSDMFGTVPTNTTNVLFPFHVIKSANSYNFTRHAPFCNGGTVNTKESNQIATCQGDGMIRTICHNGACEIGRPCSGPTVIVPWLSKSEGKELIAAQYQR